MNTFDFNKHTFYYILINCKKDKLMYVRYEEIQEELYYGNIEIPSYERYAQYLQ